MPSGKTHIAIGTATTGTLLYAWITWLGKPMPGLTPYLLIAPVVYVYSLLPDIDSYAGTLRTALFKIVFAGLTLTWLAYFWLGLTKTIIALTVIGLTGTFIMYSKHRGKMHTLGFTIITSLPMLYFHWFLALLAAVNATSHIAWDKIITTTKKVMKNGNRLEQTTQ